MAGNVTQSLARFAATLTYDQIPVRAREHCKNLLLDAVACALAGHQGEETHQVAALASGLAQSLESSVIGGDRLSLAGATLLNGYLITAVTMCVAFGDCQRRRVRGDDPHRGGNGLAGCARQRLARPRRPRAVRRRC